MDIQTFMNNDPNNQTLSDWCSHLKSATFFKYGKSPQNQKLQYNMIGLACIFYSVSRMMRFGIIIRHGSSSFSFYSFLSFGRNRWQEPVQTWVANQKCRLVFNVFGCYYSNNCKCPSNHSNLCLFTKKTALPKQNCELSQKCHFYRGKTTSVHKHVN